MTLSTCLGGDISAWAFGGGADDMLATCLPLGAEVWKITDQTVMRDCGPSRSPAHEGLHGMDLPKFGRP